MLHLTLYSKEDCHLCHEVRRMLERLQGEFPMEIKEVDISREGRLFHQYRLLIPVVIIEESTTLVAPISEAQLRQALSHARRES